MGFTSQLFPGEQIINDFTPEHATQPPPGQSRGLMPPELRHSLGYSDFEAVYDFPAELLIPESEWQARIQEMEERKTRTSDVIDQAGLPCKDQGQTNYCWINAPTHCVECERVIQNQDTVILSPASAGAQIKNYRNDGGWGREGLEFIVQYGLVPVDKWPANAISRQYFDGSRENAALHKVTEWYDLRPDNLDQLMACLFARIPVAVGYDWWRHEVCAVDPVRVSAGNYGVRIRNSWGDWGENGFGILSGSKAIPDDAVAPRVTLPSTS